MKLPAHILALCVATAGCETAVDFERRSAPPAPTRVKGTPERIEIVQEQPRFAQPPPAAAPITKPVVTKRPAPKPIAQPKAHVCGPCGMG
jgi:hypothetical protein